MQNTKEKVDLLKATVNYMEITKVHADGNILGKNGGRIPRSLGSRSTVVVRSE